MDSQILIRADIGPQVGTGHVMRTAALASAFIRLGGRATMLCDQRLPGSLKHRLEKLGLTIQQIKANNLIDDAIQTRQLAEDLQADWIIIDGYQFDDAYQQVLKLSLAELMVLDDFGHATHRAADLILNQNIYAEPANYEVDSHQVICGSDFVLLRAEFENLEPKTTVPKTAKRILLTFGGTDEGNMTTECLHAMTDIAGCEAFLVDVVVGACNQHHESIKQLVKRLPFNAIVHRNVDRMSSILNQCDMAVTAGGSTCYELARCGVPALVISTAENQQAVAKAFSESGCMISLGDAKGLNQQTLTEEMGGLVTDSDQRAEMIEKGRQIVDGRGAERIARRLMQSQIVFRDATLTDAASLLAWRNDPFARQASFQSHRVHPSEHETWLVNTLANNLMDLLIVELDDQAIGQVRFEFESSGDEAPISISVAKQHRNQGMGKAIIEAACRRTFLNDDVEAIVALIKPGNEASYRAFKSIGFVEQNPIAVYGQDAKRLVLQREALIPKSPRTRSNPAPWRKSA